MAARQAEACRRHPGSTWAGSAWVGHTWAGSAWAGYTWAVHSWAAKAFSAVDFAQILEDGQVHSVWAPHLTALCLVSTWKQGVALTAEAERGEGPGAPAWASRSDMPEAWLPEGLRRGLQDVPVHGCPLPSALDFPTPVPFTQGGGGHTLLISYSAVTISHPAHLKEIPLMEQKFQSF